jgi:phosphoribosylformylglycinamidine (FGAM) synthase-like enzyme
VLLQPLRIYAEDDPEALLATLHRLAEKNFLTGTQAVGAGGVWTALVCGCAAHERGFHCELSESEGASVRDALLGERAGCVLVSTRPKAHLPLANFVERGGLFTAEAIGRVTASDIRVRWIGNIVFEAPSLEALTR